MQDTLIKPLKNETMNDDKHWTEKVLSQKGKVIKVATMFSGIGAIEYKR